MQQPAEVEHFDPARDWPQAIVFHANFSILLEEMAFLGDTRSRCELLVFAQANPARAPIDNVHSPAQYPSAKNDE